ncbi:MAG: hypothetical protein SOW59_02820 [Corynebacterium sp.]|nr:hypothetical protein [Corynebacterium sp.]
MVLLACVTGVSLALTGCSFTSTNSSTDIASNSSQGKAKSGSEEKYPHAAYVNSLSGVSDDEKEQIIASVPLEKRDLLGSALSWATSGNYYSYSGFESTFREARTAPERDQFLPSYEQDSPSGPKDTDMVLSVIKDNVDFRYYALGMAKFITDRVGTPYRTRVQDSNGYSNEFESVALNEPQVEEWINELHMTKKESEAVLKGLEHFFAKYDLTWQDYANNFAEAYYDGNRSDFSVDKLRAEMKSQQYSGKEIDKAIKYLEETVK